MFLLVRNSVEFADLMENISIFTKKTCFSQKDTQRFDLRDTVLLECFFSGEWFPLDIGFSRHVFY